ncbi:hypothetical protein PRK78_004521 [Emydomyces testavorans]|uniref:Uncharacterized protein n=1 Tax=Emydomyces testavorans TaxID=2070801 RepID=A0AAF0IJA9_9EURO|nr:hypothetical protein PRK78_004521 [Emydomyces testavorans]
MLQDKFHRIVEQAGIDFDPIPRCPGLLRQAGFQDVELTEKVVPIGTWPKDKKLKTRGRYFMAQFLGHALETYTLALFTRTAGWTTDEVYDLIGGVAEEMSTNKMHLYTHLCVFSFLHLDSSDFGCQVLTLRPAPMLLAESRRIEQYTPLIAYLH